MPMSKRTAALALAATTSLALGAAGTAHADPKHSDAFTVYCDTLGPVDVVVFSNAIWPPALASGSNQVLAPYRLELEITFTPAGGGTPEVVIEQFSKPAPKNGRLDHCSFVDSAADDSGSWDVVGDVWV